MSTADNELEGKVSLITGASRGLGKTIAIKFANLGSKVVINYLANDEAAADVASEIKENGGEVLLFKADVADSKAVKDMGKAIIEKWGKIDILVNNAAVVKDNLVLRMSDDAWDDVINTDLRSAFLCTRFALRSMMDQFWGRIINISSLAGILGNLGQTNYSAAKGGLIAFTKSVAKEAGSRNITANAIAPGFITTDMTDQLSEENREMILSRISLKRYGTPEDIAELAAFLASDRSGYITGQVICVDGGVI